MYVQTPAGWWHTHRRIVADHDLTRQDEAAEFLAEAIPLEVACYKGGVQVQRSLVKSIIPIGRLDR